jgi:DNA-binding IclR family transcriptional regulator
MLQDDKKTAAVKQVPAVTRALKILRFLARTAEPVGVNPIARELGLVPSTCLHILRVLQDEGLVELDEATKRYSIGIGILPLARSALQRNSFSVLVQPRLSELSEQFGVTGIATQFAEPAQMVVVAMSQASNPFRLQVDLGSRFPALISATGRLFAAHNVANVERLEREFNKLAWDHPPSFAEWLDQVEQSRKAGFAVDRGVYISGVTIVAIPVFGPGGKMTRSLVSVGISERLSEGDVPDIAEAMKAIRDNRRLTQ